MEAHPLLSESETERYSDNLYKMYFSWRISPLDDIFRGSV